VKPKSVDKVAIKIFNKIWTFPHCLPYSSPDYKKSRKAVAQDRKISFKHLPRSAVTRWLLRVEDR
jgi:hypothetical protein